MLVDHFRFVAFVVLGRCTGCRRCRHGGISSYPGRCKGWMLWSEAYTHSRGSVKGCAPIRVLVALIPWINLVDVVVISRKGAWWWRHLVMLPHVRQVGMWLWESSLRALLDLVWRRSSRLGDPQCIHDRGCVLVSQSGSTQHVHMIPAIWRRQYGMSIFVKRSLFRGANLNPKLSIVSIPNDEMIARPYMILVTESLIWKWHFKSMLLNILMWIEQ